MNHIKRLPRKVTSFLGKLLYSSLAVCLLGTLCAPAQAATTVTVDQQPLIIQQPLPPNITLMLDDSGSMAWDYMPDFGYLKNNGNNDALIDASNNGVYYNPTVTYTPPVKANGTSYSNANGLTSAWYNGFSSSGNVDLTTYNGGYDTGNINYSASITVPKTTTSSQTSTYNNIKQSDCDDYYHNQSGATGENFIPNSNGNKGTCVITYSQTTTTYVTYNYFQYSTGVATGPYTVHYVSTDCGNLTSSSTPIDCVLASDTSGVAAPTGVSAGQNIANWFAYYHTRILMAKSGLMSAFSTVDPTFRVGFGSINGNNDSNLPSPTATFGNNNNKIAEVAPFGDGSSGTQKDSFWKWVAGEKASSSTPLRLSLQSVGLYYQSSQPWTTMSSDPNYTTNKNTELACRQAYTILTTDGFWNGGTPSNIGNADGAAGTQVTGPNGQSYTYAPVAPYQDGTPISSTTAKSFSQYITKSQCQASYNAAQDASNYSYNSSGRCRYNYTVTTTSTASYSDTLADVAMNYWETDLRPTTANEVATSTEDPAFWQHMTTFTLGLGFTPSGITPAGTTVDQIFSWANGGAPIAGFSWPKPSSDSLNNIADLAHAAVDGHGGFYSATSPQAFSSGLADALKRATERVGTGASLAANSTQLSTGTVAYQANYYTSKWKGDLKALAIDGTTGVISTTPTWSAASQLPAFSSRNIQTYNPVSGLSVAFTSANLGSLSTTQQSALGSSATAQQTMINYLRGDASQEQKNSGTFRNRDTPLGDIVDSQPVYAGKPDPNQFTGESFTGASTFVAYANTNASREQLVLVAANDGMLHVFDAGTGVEKFAYLPGAVINSGLSVLSNPSYGTTTAVPHKYFNDGELTVADVYFSSTSTWHTVAVGTTGRGTARAIYALDITDPANIALLWERSSGDGLLNSSFIGQMTGKPVVAQTASGTWSVLMGNGYNSTSGLAALLQFDVASGTLSVHAVTDVTQGNGLAAPAVWIGDLTNGISTVAYAGDLHGQVWSFQLNTGTTAYSATPTSIGSLLFTAKDASDNVQPITAGMLAGKDPATSNVWLFFGTGAYLNASDLTNTSTQTWYGVIAQSTTATLVTNLGNGRSSLMQRAIVAETAGNASATPPVSPGRAITPTPATPDMAGESGWYIDITSPLNGTQGERMVTPNIFQGNQLIGTTRIPLATDACNPTGSGWIMSLNPFTGTGPTENFFDLNGDGSINSGDSITVGGKTYANSGIGFSSLPNNPIFVGSQMLVSFDNGGTGSFSTSGSGGGLNRVSWRELINQ